MNFIALILYTFALFYLYHGTDILKRDPREKSHQAFFGIALTAFWLALSFAFFFGTQKTWFWLNSSYLSWVFLPVLIIYICLLLSRKHRTPWRFLYPVYILFGFFFLYLAFTNPIKGLFHDYSGGSTIRAIFRYFGFPIYYLSGAILGSLFLADWRKKTTWKGEKQKTGIIYTTMLLSFFLIFLFETLFLVFRLSAIPRITPLMASPLLLGMWFALSRYPLTDINLSIASEEILASIQDLFLLASPTGEILQINNRSLDFLGYRKEELLGKPLFDFLEEEERDDLTRVLKGTSSHLQKETFLKGRETIPVKMKVTSIHDQDGDQVWSIFVFQNRSTTYLLQKEAKKRKEIEEQLRKTQKDLKKEDQQKTDFLSLISHELRTPLTSILGFSQIINKKFASQIIPVLSTEEKTLKRAIKQFQGNVDIIISEAKRLTSLINDLLDITKMESGHMDWHIEPLKIQEIINPAIASTSSLFEAKGLPLYKDIEENIPTIEGDRDRLIQVLINLLSNAVKFTREGRVTCQARFMDGSVIIQIIDTGKGIPNKDLKNVFQRYHQVKGTTREGYHGTGLGLSISQEIIEYHGGRIWAESTPGEGSIFSFTLPLKKELTQENTYVQTSVKNLWEQLKRKEEKEEKKKEILIVDDDGNIRHLLVDCLKENDYKMREASNGQEALEKIHAKNPHLIIMDIQMPQLNGLETLSLLKKDLLTFPIPVIIITVIDEKEKAMSLGAYAFIEKPLKLPEFKKIIAEALTKRDLIVTFLIYENKETRERLKKALEEKNYLVTALSSPPPSLTSRPDIIIMEKKWEEELKTNLLYQEKRILCLVLED